MPKPRTRRSTSWLEARCRLHAQRTCSHARVSFRACVIAYVCMYVCMFISNLRKRRSQPCSQHCTPNTTQPCSQHCTPKPRTRTSTSWLEARCRLHAQRTCSHARVSFRACVRACVCLYQTFANVDPNLVASTARQRLAPGRVLCGLRHFAFICAPALDNMVPLFARRSLAPGRVLRDSGHVADCAHKHTQR